MTVNTALELSGTALAGLVTVAQIPSADGGVIEMLLKTGAVGIVGIICIVLIRENRKTIESIESAHKEAANRFEKSTDRIVESVDQMVKNCASKNGAGTK
jgi:hypothetical protein